MVFLATLWKEPVSQPHCCGPAETVRAEQGILTRSRTPPPPPQRCPADPRPHSPAPRPAPTRCHLTADPPVLSGLLGQPRGVCSWQPGCAGGTQRLRACHEEAKTSLSLSLTAKAGCPQPAGFIGSPGPPPLLLWRPGRPPRKTAVNHVFAGPFSPTLAGAQFH